MESLERLFGREITNVEEQALLKNNARRGKAGLRSLSFCGEEPRPIIPRVRETINPNVSQRIQKPRFAKENELEQQELKESLTDYFDEAIAFMLAQEAALPAAGCLARQTEVTESMRTILLDWIVDVHLKFKMFPQTLFLVVAIVDKYLSLRAVKREELQLLGSAALLVAAKYEETYQVPESSELVSLSARAFSKGDLLRMEAEILKALDFNLIFSTAYHFLAPLCKITSYDPKKFCLAQYALELALMDTRFHRFKPSLLASAAIFLINKIKRAEVVWPDALVAASGYEEKELRSCARELCQLLEQADLIANIKCLRRKFSLPKYYEVSNIRLEKRENPKASAKLQPF